MRIGIEAQRLFRKKKHGMEIVALELIRELQKIDSRNEYVIFTRNGEDSQCLTPTSNFRVEQISAYSYADWEQWHLPQRLKREKIDLLHCTANTTPLGLSIPLVLTLHDIIYLESLNFSGSPYQNFGNIYRRYVVPRGARKSKIITVSEYEKGRIAERLKVAENQIEVIYNAINAQFGIKRNAQEVKSILERYKLPDSFLLFFGNTAPKKNTFRVVQAFCQYCRIVKSDIIPLVITDCSEDYIYGILEKIGCREIMKNIYVRDYISFQDLPCIYSSANIFLYPSLRESFGMPIIEAQACGAPVITSSTSSMPEIAGEGALLVDPFNPDEITDGIFKFLENGALREKFVREGFSNVKRFSWQNAAKQLVLVYESMTAERCCYSRQTVV